MIGLMLAARAVAADPPVRVEVAPGQHFAGEAIRVDVSLVTTNERPEVQAPQVEGALIVPVGSRSIPLSTSGIGDVVAETKRTIETFWVVPRRPGTLALPPFAVTLRSRTLRSPTTRLPVQAPPLAGRTGSFLGGVGRLDGVVADVRPGRVRVGQELEFTLQLRGTASLGSFEPPRLGGLEGLQWDGKAPDTEASAPPGDRLFRWMLRATRPGQARIPGVAASWFDPETRRYQTRVGRPLAVEVVSVPRFDESRVVEPRRVAQPRGAVVLGSAAGAMLVVLAIVAGAWARVRFERRSDPRRVARRLARRLRSGRGAEETARIVERALAEYLRVASGRPPGALDPGEVGREMVAVTQDAALAADASQLMERCDRARFSGREASSGELVAAASALFVALARKRIPPEGDQVSTP